MNIPRVSVLTLMAVVLVVSLDGVAIRLIAARPEFVLDSIGFAAMMTLPMVNILAIAAAMRTRRRGGARAFLVGFEAAGWATVVASFVWRRAILSRIVSSLEASLPPAWLTWIIEAPIVAYVMIFGVYVVAQCLVARLCGLMARWAFCHFARTGEPIVEPSPSGSRLVPLIWFVAIVAFPIAAIEGYLRVTVDPQLRDPAIARLARGTEAVVDRSRMLGSPASPANLLIVELDGTRVRVVADTDPWQCEWRTTLHGPPKIVRSHRIVHFTVREGDRKGEAMFLPHYVLRPLP